MSVEQDVARYMAWAESVFGKPPTPAEWDALALERAAQVLRSRSTKPYRNFWLGVFCNVLTGCAAKIRAEDSHAAD